MSEMIERVAKAIFAVHNRTYDSWEEAGGDVPHSTTRTYYFAEARAALDEIRETLTSMLLCELAHPSRKYHGMRFEHAIPMMIAAVLSPPLAHGEASEVRDDR